MTYKTLFVLGRQPDLSKAELESLLEPKNVSGFGEHALTSFRSDEVPFERLGGALKGAKILTSLPSLNWKEIESYLTKNVPLHANQLGPGKLTLGLSVYGLATSADDINKTALKLKKLIKTSGRPVRIVPNQSPELNTAQVLHNKLVGENNGWELIVVSNGKTAVLAQTIFVQDIDAYAARDQARPKRDSVVGMLPPKLAQIIINLASEGKDGIVYDPFCGTGVVLQEALLMGYEALGSDINPKMVEYSQANLDWLKKTYPGRVGSFQVGVTDATQEVLDKDFDFIASEVFLGPVLKGRESVGAIDEASAQTNQITEGFLSILAKKDFKRACLAVPCWQIDGRFIHLPILDHLADLGYNRTSFVHAGPEAMIYHRPGQVVARELIVLEKL